MLERRGSLQACFSAGLNDDDDTILPALSAFTRELSVCADNNLEHLVPSPIKGSACKRLNLFLRWMVRSDEVDPGGWEDVPVSKLIVPVDTHMHRICKLLGFTARNQAHMGTADRAISDLGMSVRELARRLEMNSPGVVFLVERGETICPRKWVAVNRIRFCYFFTHQQPSAIFSASMAIFLSYSFGILTVNCIPIPPCHLSTLLWSF